MSWDWNSVVGTGGRIRYILSSPVMPPSCSLCSLFIKMLCVVLTSTPFTSVHNLLSSRVRSRQRRVQQQVRVDGGMYSSTLVGSSGGTLGSSSNSNMAATADKMAADNSVSNGRVFTTTNNNLIHIPGAAASHQPDQVGSFAVLPHFVAKSIFVIYSQSNILSNFAQSAVTFKCAGYGEKLSLPCARQF